jgi:diadenosine tetraphosphate (Ap4A) HIT family hydrolase
MTDHADTLAREPRSGCPLCNQIEGVSVTASALWRVVRVEDTAFPAFYRLIWREHVAEWTDLPAPQRSACMQAVAKIEMVLRHTLTPTKINLASLGNVVPHLHWHVIARFDWDSHFPQPVWGTAQRSVEPSPLQRLPLTLEALDARVADALASFGAD